MSLAHRTIIIYPKQTTVWADPELGLGCSWLSIDTLNLFSEVKRLGVKGTHVSSLMWMKHTITTLPTTLVMYSN